MVGRSKNSWLLFDEREDILLRFSNGMSNVRFTLLAYRTLSAKGWTRFENQTLPLLNRFENEVLEITQTILVD